ncbi:hypothetical protein [Kitasatospora sp. A2-31]|uniref:hypothetical protein n=1 Tax=Kitasatospora sp. A2-31 TaxID=2916414 RepID=UPI001EECB547|nr:hypothetical protein [Kitasatospora sp. A2-31]MCG6495925.1 hypothetical protein [Kitasatospora sp. A2-31]
MRGRPPVPAWAGVLLGLSVLAPAALGALLYARLAPAVRDVPLQLAGTRAAAAAVVAGRVPEYRAALTADGWLVAGYTLTLLAAGLLGRYVLGREHWRLAALAAGGAGLLAGACDVAEDVLLAAGLDGVGGAGGPDGTDRLVGPGGSDAPFAAAAALSTVKWVLLLPAGAAAAVVVAVTLHRAVRALLRRPPEPDDPADGATDDATDDGARPAAGAAGRTAGADAGTATDAGAATAAGPAAVPAGPPDRRAAGPALIPPWPVATPHGGRWPPGRRTHRPLDHQARWRNGALVPPGREHAALGFCASGGGIRSACVTLGALQVLRPWLMRSRYLVSVSGGGYAVGALQLALCDSAPGSAVHAVSGLTAADVLAPGSPEEDHLRRHAKYLADGAGQWLVALGTLLRGLVSALTLLLAAILTLGLGLSRCYHLVPLADLDALAAVGLRTGGAVRLGPLPVRTPAVLALVGLLTTAAVCWLLWLLAFPLLGWNSLLPRALRRLGHGALALAGLVAVGVLVVPGLAWGAVALQQALAVGARQTGAGLSLTVLLSYLALLLGILWRSRRAIEIGTAALGGLVGGARRVGGGLGARVTQYLVVWAALGTLSVGALLALGWAVATGHAWPVAAQVLLPLVLATVGLNLDQTWTGLHPFYRRRLASAFAVRRSTEDGEVLARPYHFHREQTRLSHYGARHPGFPQVVFAAAANLSGNSRTPPGRRAVSFTFSHDYVGGPDVGYARTDLLERRTRRHITRDLTVQSAMAVSGAAFSSAMGRQSRVYQGLFAVTNARLGTWLPNPAALDPLWAPDRDWRHAPQPGVRRLPYQLRELCGRFPMDDRFLLTTDGGHYENLGLVELLRHGVRTAVCIDASGDAPLAATLAAAITLAREELGITITLHEPELLIPGSLGARGGPAGPPLRGLAARLADRFSARAVITGTIRYPAPLDLPEDGYRDADRDADRDRGWYGDGDGAGRPGPADVGPGGEDGRHLGTLIVVQAVLTPDMPYELHAYAAANPAFPNDSTGDQWFDHRQFDAYQTLGRHLGELAAPVLSAVLTGPGRTAPTAPTAPTSPIPAPAASAPPVRTPSEPTSQAPTSAKATSAKAASSEPASSEAASAPPAGPLPGPSAPAPPAPRRPAEG